MKYVGVIMTVVLVLIGLIDVFSTVQDGLKLKKFREKHRSDAQNEGKMGWRTHISRFGKVATGVG